MNIRSIFASIIILFTCISAFAQTRGPAETVRAFYQFSDARSITFNRRHIESRKRWYTPELYQLFRDILKKDTTYLKLHPTNKPFFGDGLDFAPLQETCEVKGKRYGYTRTVGSYSVRKSIALVEVRWSFPAVCHDQPIKWHMKLRMIGGRWLIDVLVYPDGGSLVEEMTKHNYGGAT